MVRNYVRKSSRAEYGPADMQLALAAISTGELSRRQASITYGIPRATLIKRLKNSDHTPTSLGRFRRVFDDEFEKELIDYALEMQRRCYGLSLADLGALLINWQ